MTKTVSKNMNRMKKKYQQAVRSVLQKEFGSNNPFAVARITKVTINMGVTRPVEVSERGKVVENVVKQFEIITGQHPQVTKAKKAVAEFKLRQGDPLGVMVTLRGEKMWEFLDKLVSITLPRVKDFRGISKKAFDGQGNYSLGLEEQIVFPEIDYDQIEGVRGLQVNIGTSAQSDQESLRLLELLGFPFEKEEASQEGRK